MSSMDAALFLLTPNFSAISLATGPAITMATVLLAVHRSTSSTRMPMPSSAPRLPLTVFSIVSIIRDIPPFYFISDTMQATIIEMIDISNMLVMPSPMIPNDSMKVNDPL